MRLLVLTPLLVLAACSGGGEPAEKQAEAPAKELRAGEWEISREVTDVTPRDDGPPAIKAAVGDKAVGRSCVAPGDVKKPQGELFAAEGSECTSRDLYMSGGRLNATLACSRPGLSGNIATIVNGTFKAESIEATATTETSLLSQGDVRIVEKLTGRRVGECPAEPTPS